MEFIVVWFICGFICSVIAGAKGRSAGAFFFMGLLLGPLGIILALVTAKNERQIEKEWVESGEMRKCPFCAELVKAEAIKCKHCQSDLEPEEPPTDAKIVSCLVDAKDTTKKIAECSCGRRFRYEMREAGKKIKCTGCRGQLVLQ